MAFADLTGLVAEDFRQLRLTLKVDGVTEDVHIHAALQGALLATITSVAIGCSDDPARLVIEVGRAVAPKRLD